MAPRRRVSAALGAQDHLELRCGLMFRRFWGRHRTEAEHLEHLAGVWRVHGARIAADHRPGRRPWGWWMFEAGEEMPAWPDSQPQRLVELGAVGTGELVELAAIADRFVAQHPPPYLDVPGQVEDGNVARAALGLPAAVVEVLPR